MNRLSARIGLWAALTNSALSFVYLVGVIILMSILLARQTPAELAASAQWTNIREYAAHYADNPLTMTVGLIVQGSAFLSGLVILVIVLALHEIVEPEKRIITRIAGAFALLLAVTSSLTYYIQIASVHQVIMAGGDLEGLGQFAESNVSSPAMASLQLGWAFFYGLVTLLVVPALGNGRVEAWIKALFLCNGVVGVVVGIAYALGVTVLLPFSMVSLVASSFAYPLLAVVFNRAGRDAGRAEAGSQRHSLQVN